MRQILPELAFAFAIGARHIPVMARPISSENNALPGHGRALDYRATAHVGDGSAYRSQRLFDAIIICAVFLSTWRVLRWGWTNVTVSDIGLVVAGSFLLMRGRLNVRPLGELSSVWYLAFAAMIGGLLLGSLANGEPVRWLIGSAQYFLALVFVPMLFMSLDRHLLVQSMKAFVLGVALSQIIGIVAAQFFDFHDTYWTIDHGFITPNGRIGAMSGEPNLNGATCAFGFAMLAYLYLSRLITVRFAALCGVAIGWGLLMSASFTGFSATMFALVVIVTLSGLRGTARIGLPVLVAVACYVLLGGPLPEAFAQRVGGAITTGNLSMAGTYVERSQLIREAWAMADSHLLVGVGLDGYRDVSSYGIPVHNLFLLLTNEGGLLSIGGLLAMLGILLAWFIGTYRRHRLEGSVGLAVLGVFIIYAMAIPHMYTRVWTIPVMLCAALALQSLRLPPHTSE
ncbi:MAG: hypothetical protein WBH10_05570 [Allopontixanthobacter sediminis]